MKIEKAINILSAMQEDYEGDEFPNEEEALKLGIEALKRFKRIQEDYPFAHTWRLEGETDESNP